MNLDLPEAGLLQGCFQLRIPVDDHSLNSLCPFLVFVRIPTALIADEEGAARLQNPVDLPEALGQIRPKIYCLKSRRCVKPPASKQRLDRIY